MCGLSGPAVCRSSHLASLICPGPNFCCIDGLSWFDDVISDAMKATPEQLSIDVSFYVTDTTAAVDDGASVQSEQSKLGGDRVSRSTGRPQLHAVVKDFCAEEGTVAIASASSHVLSLSIPSFADAISYSLRPGLVQPRRWHRRWGVRTSHCAGYVRLLRDLPPPRDLQVRCALRRYAFRGSRFLMLPLVGDSLRLHPSLG